MDQQPVPARCVCWMLREVPLGAICQSFRPHPELTIGGEVECANCRHPEPCHLAMLDDEDDQLAPG